MTALGHFEFSATGGERLEAENLTTLFSVKAKI